MTDRAGQQLGNYRLLRLLGSGGFADVYLGEHLYLKTQAAIKILHAQLTADMVNHFLTEAQTIAHLVHPHIVRILDFGMADTTPFLVMEYAPNGTLRQRHARGIPLPLTLIVSYVQQIASALQYAHDQRFIHRDIKPENMLLGAHDEVLLSDFGIATISQTSRSMPTQDISGTISYMAPEQIQGRARPASDQYSLGVIVYEWLTGYCPFQGSFAEVASQHIFAEPPSVRARHPHLPAALEEVLQIVLAKNPEQRFARVDAFANALAQACGPIVARHSIPDLPVVSLASDAEATVLTTPSTVAVSQQSGPVSLPPHVLYAPPPPVVPGASHAPLETPPSIPDVTIVAPNGEAQPSRKVSRRFLLAGLAALAALGGGGATWFALSHNSSPALSPTPTTAPNPQPTATSAPSPTATSQPQPTATTPPGNIPVTYHGPSNMYTVTWDTTGSRLAGAGEGSLIQIINPTTGAVYFTMDTGNTRIYHVAWSPDGTRIATAQEDSNIQIWDVNNRVLLHTLSGHTGKVNGVSWSPDSTKLVSGSADKTAIVWDVNGGTQLFSYTGHAHWINAVSWSPDGNLIVSGSGDHTAQVWQAANGTPIYTYNGHSNEVLALAWSQDSARIASASDDSTAQVWGATNGTHFVTYTGHSGFVVALDWSRNGQYIATGGVDTTVQVWSANTGQSVYVYHGHHAEVEGIAWAPDSRHIASASDDGTMQIWTLP
ncbi:MAG TPA: protein kinase [Ktedonobacteraceae bacterium]|jgi:serine/threonine protein kinase|nr:protein kinase [Ktedonobacteraceae bacterium]